MVPRPLLARRAFGEPLRQVPKFQRTVVCRVVRQAAVELAGAAQVVRPTQASVHRLRIGVVTASLKLGLPEGVAAGRVREQQVPYRRSSKAEFLTDGLVLAIDGPGAVRALSSPATPSGAPGPPSLPVASLVVSDGAPIDVARQAVVTEAVLVRPARESAAAGAAASASTVAVPVLLMAEAPRAQLTAASSLRLPEAAEGPASSRYPAGLAAATTLLGGQGLLPEALARRVPRLAIEQERAA